MWREDGLLKGRGEGIWLVTFSGTFPEIVWFNATVL
jgi:hypothetical protein